MGIWGVLDAWIGGGREEFSFPFVAYMSGEIDYGHALNNAVINSGGVLPHLFRERGR